MSVEQELHEDPDELEGPDLRSQLAAGELDGFVPPKLPEGVKAQLAEAMDSFLVEQDIGNA